MERKSRTAAGSKTRAKHNQPQQRLSGSASPSDPKAQSDEYIPVYEAEVLEPDYSSEGDDIDLDALSALEFALDNIELDDNWSWDNDLDLSPEEEIRLARVLAVSSSPFAVAYTMKRAAALHQHKLGKINQFKPYVAKNKSQQAPSSTKIDPSLDANAKRTTSKNSLAQSLQSQAFTQARSFTQDQQQAALDPSSATTHNAFFATNLAAANPSISSMARPTGVKSAVSEPFVTDSLVSKAPVVDPVVSSEANSAVLAPSVTAPSVTVPSVTAQSVVEPSVVASTEDKSVLSEPAVTTPPVLAPYVTKSVVTENTIAESVVTRSNIAEPKVAEPSVVAYFDASSSVTGNVTSSAAVNLASPSLSNGDVSYQSPDAVDFKGVNLNVNHSNIDHLDINESDIDLSDIDHLNLDDSDIDDPAESYKSEANTAFALALSSTLATSLASTLSLTNKQEKSTQGSVIDPVDDFASSDLAAQEKPYSKSSKASTTTKSKPKRKTTKSKRKSDFAHNFGGDCPENFIDYEEFAAYLKQIYPDKEVDPAELYDLAVFAEASELANQDDLDAANLSKGVDLSQNVKAANGFDGERLSDLDTKISASQNDSLGSTQVAKASRIPHAPTVSPEFAKSLEAGTAFTGADIGSDIGAGADIGYDAGAESVYTLQSPWQPPKLHHGALVTEPACASNVPANALESSNNKLGQQVNQAYANQAQINAAQANAAQTKAAHVNAAQGNAVQATNAQANTAHASGTPANAAQTNAAQSTSVDQNQAPLVSPELSKPMTNQEASTSQLNPLNPFDMVPELDFSNIFSKLSPVTSIALGYGEPFSVQLGSLNQTQQSQSPFLEHNAQSGNVNSQAPEQTAHGKVAYDSTQGESVVLTYTKASLAVNQSVPSSLADNMVYPNDVHLDDSQFESPQVTGDAQSLGMNKGESSSLTLKDSAFSDSHRDIQLGSTQFSGAHSDSQLESTQRSDSQISGTLGNSSLSNSSKVDNLAANSSLPNSMAVKTNVVGDKAAASDAFNLDLANQSGNTSALNLDPSQFASNASLGVLGAKLNAQRTVDISALLAQLQSHTLLKSFTDPANPLSAIVQQQIHDFVIGLATVSGLLPEQILNALPQVGGEQGNQVSLEALSTQSTLSTQHIQGAQNLQGALHLQDKATLSNSLGQVNQQIQSNQQIQGSQQTQDNLEFSAQVTPKAKTTSKTKAKVGDKAQAAALPSDLSSSSSSVVSSGLTSSLDANLSANLNANAPANQSVKASANALNNSNANAPVNVFVDFNTNANTNALVNALTDSKVNAPAKSSASIASAQASSQSLIQDKTALNQAHALNTKQAKGLTQSQTQSHAQTQASKLNQEQSLEQASKKTTPASMLEGNLKLNKQDQIFTPEPVEYQGNKEEAEEKKQEKEIDSGSAGVQMSSWVEPASIPDKARLKLRSNFELSNTALSQYESEQSSPDVETSLQDSAEFGLELRALLNTSAPQISTHQQFRDVVFLCLKQIHCALDKLSERSFQKYCTLIDQNSQHFNVCICFNSKGEITKVYSNGKTYSAQRCVKALKALTGITVAKNFSNEVESEQTKVTSSYLAQVSDALPAQVTDVPSGQVTDTLGQVSSSVTAPIINGSLNTTQAQVLSTKGSELNVAYNSGDFTSAIFSDLAHMQSSGTMHNIGAYAGSLESSEPNTSNAGTESYLDMSLGTTGKAGTTYSTDALMGIDSSTRAVVNSGALASNSLATQAWLNKEGTVSGRVPDNLSGSVSGALSGTVTKTMEYSSLPVVDPSILAREGNANTAQVSHAGSDSHVGNDRHVGIGAGIGAGADANGTAGIADVAGAAGVPSETMGTGVSTVNAGNAHTLSNNHELSAAQSNGKTMLSPLSSNVASSVLNAQLNAQSVLATHVAQGSLPQVTPLDSSDRSDSSSTQLWSDAYAQAHTPQLGAYDLPLATDKMHESSSQADSNSKVNAATRVNAARVNGLLGSGSNSSSNSISVSDLNSGSNLGSNFSSSSNSGVEAVSNLDETKFLSLNGTMNSAMALGGHEARDLSAGESFTAEMKAALATMATAKKVEQLNDMNIWAYANGSAQDNTYLASAMSYALEHPKVTQSIQENTEHEMGFANNLAYSHNALGNAQGNIQSDIQNKVQLTAQSHTQENVPTKTQGSVQTKAQGNTQTKSQGNTLSNADSSVPPMVNAHTLVQTQEQVEQIISSFLASQKQKAPVSIENQTKSLAETFVQNAKQSKLNAYVNQGAEQAIRESTSYAEATQRQQAKQSLSATNLAFKTDKATRGSKNTKLEQGMTSSTDSYSAQMNQLAQGNAKKSTPKARLSQQLNKGNVSADQIKASSSAITDTATHTKGLVTSDASSLVANMTAQSQDALTSFEQAQIQSQAQTNSQIKSQVQAQEPNLSYAQAQEQALSANAQTPASQNMVAGELGANYSASASKEMFTELKMATSLEIGLESGLEQSVRYLESAKSKFTGNVLTDPKLEDSSKVQGSTDSNEAATLAKSAVSLILAPSQGSTVSAVTDVSAVSDGSHVSDSSDVSYTSSKSAALDNLSTSVESSVEASGLSTASSTKSSSILGKTIVQPESARVLLERARGENNEIVELALSSELDESGDVLQPEVIKPITPAKHQSPTFGTYDLSSKRQEEEEEPYIPPMDDDDDDEVTVCEISDEDEGVRNYKPHAIAFTDLIHNLATPLEITLLKITDKHYQKQCLMRNQFGDMLKVLVYYKATGEISKVRCAADSHIGELFTDALQAKKFITGENGLCMVV